MQFESLHCSPQNCVLIQAKNVFAGRNMLSGHTLCYQIYLSLGFFCEPVNQTLNGIQRFSAIM